jgi:two-component system alkaline phosphatase synthesis response regulator PhoP
LSNKNKGARFPRRPDPCAGRTIIPASILIADDDANIVAALRFLMRREGHAVRVAADGRETLAAIAEAVPDLLLLDLMMPRGNGHDVCREIRSVPAYDAMRIIMLTAKGRADDQRRGIALGADAYVTKPFAIADVVDCVASVLARPRAALAGPAPGA